ncbi:MAG TPA: hypothetical protein VKE69_14995, partial [Planctomycetota bacterium]|nr:hypothetical protein [Planctomycetota bacterium]
TATAFLVRWTTVKDGKRQIWAPAIRLADGVSSLPYGTSHLHGRVAVSAAALSDAGISPWSEAVEIDLP